MKSLQGETDLFELRPKQGRSPVRSIYVRVDNQFVILAIATNKDVFDRAVRDARTRKSRHL